MFARYKSGEKAKSIVDRLNAQGIRNKSGATFTVNSFAKIIRNSKYAGIVINNGETYENKRPCRNTANMFCPENFSADTAAHS